MTGARAAVYCDLTSATFSKWVSEGRLPPALPGTRRWDKRAIDAALDKLSGIDAPSIVPSEDSFEAWEREYESKKAARRRERV